MKRYVTYMLISFMFLSCSQSFKKGVPLLSLLSGNEELINTSTGVGTGTATGSSTGTGIATGTGTGSGTTTGSGTGTGTTTGTGTGTTSNPEIDVLISSVSYASGSNYSFGTILRGSTSASITFTISNTGMADLTLSAALSLSGANPGDFILTQPGVSNITASSTTTFTLQFVPQGIGQRTASLSISNNDADEGTYIINLSAIGSGKYIFVSSGTYNGNLKGTFANGIAGADNICSNEKNANFASLPGLGTDYKALLVDDTNRVACTTPNCGGGVAEHIDWILQANTYYVKDNGGVPVQLFLSDSKGLFTSLDTAFDSTAGKLWWTGLNSDWKTDIATYCDTWKDGTAFFSGITGKSNVINLTSINDGNAFGEACNTSKYILCVQQ
ncbi:MAG: DUF1554 domain-containing protein [Leptospiraceae bacterium]|nr:DUF1554 domain-containing protein [Leptospiraceae bacterium]